jgi:hypothetical protein
MDLPTYTNIWRIENQVYKRCYLQLPTYTNIWRIEKRVNKLRGFWPLIFLSVGLTAVFTTACRGSLRHAPG